MSKDRTRCSGHFSRALSQFKIPLLYTLLSESYSALESGGMAGAMRFGMDNSKLRAVINREEQVSMFEYPVSET
jgi:hypothetical protein